MFFLLTANSCMIVGEEQSLPKKTILVSAAASMTDIMLDIKQQFEKSNPEISVKLNFGSSGSLQQQIENGAPTDIFISAGKRQPDALVKKGLAEQSQIVAKNTLVIISNKDLNLKDFNQLLTIKLDKIAIGNPETVPAGEYAKQAFIKTNMWKPLANHFVFAKDVRQVLSYVETGNAEAGVVYKTDALKASANTRFIEINPEYYLEIIYPAVIVSSTKNHDLAQIFMDYLLSQEAEALFIKHGFRK